MAHHRDLGLPERIESVEQLEEVMTTPDPALIADLEQVDGDLMILGAGGKMGPTLARLAKRAAPSRRVIAVARFSEEGLEARLEHHGIETIRADLLDRSALADLPAAPNVVFMAGRKFGTRGEPDLTWALNVFLPGLVAETFRTSRIVAFSTGNVYPWVRVTSPGASERTPLLPPPGEYANACVGRERMFEYFSKRHRTPGRLIRLNYAIDLRYGVLADLALRILGGVPIDLEMGHVNVIWQGDANAFALRALAHCTTPTTPLNVTGTDVLSVRALARALARRMDRRPIFRGIEGETAWLNDARSSVDLFGAPLVPLETMLDWVADWVGRGGESLNKPTHFEVRTGSY